MLKLVELMINTLPMLDTQSQALARKVYASLIYVREKQWG